MTRHDGANPIRGAGGAWLRRARCVAHQVGAETYVDHVTRRRFDNYAEYAALYGDAAPSIAELELPRVKSARQLPRTVRARLDARAAAITGAAQAA